MKKLLLLLTLALAGCDEGKIYWEPRYTPTTDVERRAVADNVERVLGARPLNLAGHDQDWDDAIKAAHAEARRSLCRETLWERVYLGDYAWSDTGRWRYADEKETR